MTQLSTDLLTLPTWWITCFHPFLSDWGHLTQIQQESLVNRHFRGEVLLERMYAIYGYGQKHKAWITHPNPHTIHTSIHRVWIKRLALPLPQQQQQQQLLLLLLLLLLPPLLLLLHLLPLLLLPLLLLRRRRLLLLLLLLLLRTTITSITTTTTTDLAEATRFNFKLTSHSGKRFSGIR